MEMHDKGINVIFISVGLLIEKVIELDKVILSIPYIQL